MTINSNIEFGISESGHYFLDFIPEEQISRYVDRLEHYDVYYEVVSAYKLRSSQNVREKVCCITLFKVEEVLRNRLREAYGFLDRRHHSLPISEKITCFRAKKSFIFACPNNFSNEVQIIKNYLNQHKTIEYSIIYPRDYAIFRIRKMPIAVVVEINECIQATCQTNYDKNEQRNVLEIQEMITEYNEQNRTERQIFNFGGYSQ